jgi:hypothetical protein
MCEVGGRRREVGGPAAGGVKLAAGRPAASGQNFNVAEMLFKQLNGI